MGFEALILGVGIAAGAVAAVAGFGIGSLLTPVLIPSVGGKLAVALVALPHAIATAIRLVRLRAAIDWRILRTFGVASALGSLAGALLFARSGNALLSGVLGILLVVVGVLQLAGLARRLTIAGPWSILAGVVSGALGGLVGNQGGLRSAALLGFGLSSRALVATAAAIALLVDLVRAPIYVAIAGEQLLSYWPTVIAATIGVTIGTFVGTVVLLRLSERAFQRIIGALLIVLGIWLLGQTR